jgi:hypothetical protein
MICALLRLNGFKVMAWRNFHEIGRNAEPKCLPGGR